MIRRRPRFQTLPTAKLVSALDDDDDETPFVFDDQPRPIVEGLLVPRCGTIDVTGDHVQGRLSMPRPVYVEGSGLESL